MFAFQGYQPKALRSQITDPSIRASETMSRASGSASKIRPGEKSVTKGPGPTAGGAVMAGVSGYGAGASMASGVLAGTAAAPYAAPFVAALAIGSYLFS